MQLFADVNLVAWAFLGAACLVSVILIAKSRRYFATPAVAEPRDDAQPASSEAPLLGALRSHITRTAAHDRHEALGQVSAQLHDQIDTLRQLIRDADRAAARLERAIGGTSATVPPPHFSSGATAPATAAPTVNAPQAPPSTSSPRAARTPAAPAPVRPTLFAAEESPPEEDDELGLRLLMNRSATSRGGVRRAEPSAEATRPSSQADALRPTQPPRPVALPDVPLPQPGALPSIREQRYREIYALADAGHSLEDIAQRLAMPNGEIALILSLRGAR